MARVCVQHPSQHGENLCGNCGLEFCSDCLVYPRGRRRLPLCVPCALVAGGVRSSAGRHTGLSRRELKRRVRERERELERLARFAPVREPVEAAEPAPASPREGDIARRIEAALTADGTGADHPPQRRETPGGTGSWLDDYFTSSVGDDSPR